MEKAENAAKAEKIAAIHAAKTEYKPQTRAEREAAQEYERAELERSIRSDLRQEKKSYAAKKFGLDDGEACLAIDDYEDDEADDDDDEVEVQRRMAAQVRKGGLGRAYRTYDCSCS